MRAGGLKRRVTFQKPETRRDAFGQPVKMWTDVATAWADIRDISSRELLASGALMSEATVRIWVRYRPDITTGNRIIYRAPNIAGQMFTITAVIADARHSRLEILCKGGIFDE